MKLSPKDKEMSLTEEQKLDNAMIDTELSDDFDLSALETPKIIDEYVKQMAENHAFKVDTNFWMVVKRKPRWMPSFIYKAVIKNLVEFQTHK